MAPAADGKQIPFAIICIFVVGCEEMSYPDEPNFFIPPLLVALFFGVASQVLNVLVLRSAYCEDPFSFLKRRLFVASVLFDVSVAASLIPDPTPVTCLILRLFIFSTKVTIFVSLS